MYGKIQPSHVTPEWRGLDYILHSVDFIIRDFSDRTYEHNSNRGR